MDDETISCSTNDSFPTCNTQPITTDNPVTMDTSNPLATDTSNPDTSDPVTTDISNTLTTDTSNLVTMDTADPVTMDTADPVTMDTADPVTMDTADPVTMDTADLVTMDTADLGTMDTSNTVASDNSMTSVVPMTTSVPVTCVAVVTTAATGTVPAVTTAATSVPAVTTAATSVPAVTTAATSVPAVTTAATSVPVLTTAPTSVPAVTTAPTSVPAVTMAPTSVPVLTTAATSVPAATSSKPLSVVNSESNATIDIPLNIPLSEVDLKLLALLQSNLPHLSHLQDSIKSIIQNNLILQSMKSTLASQKLAVTATPTTGSLVSVTMASSVSTPTTAMSLRKPVLAQVIGTGSSLKPTASVPVLSKPLSEPSGDANPLLDPPQTTGGIVKTLPDPIPSVQSDSLVGNQKSKLPTILKQDQQQSTVGGVTAKMSPLTALAAKISSQNILPEPSVDEPMDIDVGQTVLPVDLPSHLLDHTYCVYNPSVSYGPRPVPDRLITIPSERLSYAPEVPDSPRTLFKLLKVLPKKGSSNVGGARARTHSKSPGTPVNRSLPK